MNALSNGLTIIVEATGERFHSLKDWGLALGNNNYIGEPEAETTYIKVPGRDGYIDASEAVSGRTIYKSRVLSFSLGGIRERMSWDSVISAIRNNINGKVCKIIIDNDPAYYWRGRVFVSDFDRVRELGQFTLSIPQADPYKYNMQSSAEPWLWDPFNFETGIITDVGKQIISGYEEILIPKGNMPVSPEFIVSNITSIDFLVTYKNKTYNLKEGTTRIPQIIVNGTEEILLKFTGSGEVIIMYRGGSL